MTPLKKASTTKGTKTTKESRIKDEAIFRYFAAVGQR
jgi:hypothetical protein